MRELLVETARHLIAASDNGFVDGDDVAREIGLNPDDPAVYAVFREIQERDDLKLEGWGGDTGLPHLVLLPDA